MRVILDTNIVVSALIWGGTPYKLLQTATAGDIELFTSPVLMSELCRDLLCLEHYGNIAIVDAAKAIQAIASAGIL